MFHSLTLPRTDQCIHAYVYPRHTGLTRLPHEKRVQLCILNHWELQCAIGIDDLLPLPSTPNRRSLRVRTCPIGWWGFSISSQVHTQHVHCSRLACSWWASCRSWQDWWSSSPLSSLLPRRECGQLYLLVLKSYSVDSARLTCHHWMHVCVCHTPSFLSPSVYSSQYWPIFWSTISCPPPPTTPAGQTLLHLASSMAPSPRHPQSLYLPVSTNLPWKLWVAVHTCD